MISLKKKESCFEEEVWTFVVVQESSKQGFSFWLKFFADDGTFYQLFVLLKNLQQLDNTYPQVHTSS